MHLDVYVDPFVLIPFYVSTTSDKTGLYGSLRKKIRIESNFENFPSKQYNVLRDVLR